MDIETGMIILFVSHTKWVIYVTKLVQIHKCQNQKLQIPIFMVYEVPDMQSTKIKHNNSLMDICLETPRQHFDPAWCVFFRHSCYCTLWAKLSYRWTEKYTYRFVYQSNLYIICFPSNISSFLPNSCFVIYVTKIFPPNPVRFKRSSWLIMWLIM